MSLVEPDNLDIKRTLTCFLIYHASLEDFKAQIASKK